MGGFNYSGSSDSKEGVARIVALADVCFLERQTGESHTMVGYERLLYIEEGVWHREKAGCHHMRHHRAINQNHKFPLFYSMSGSALILGSFCKNEAEAPSPMRHTFIPPLLWLCPHSLLIPLASKPRTGRH